MWGRGRRCSHGGRRRLFRKASYPRFRAAKREPDSAREQGAGTYPPRYSCIPIAFTHHFPPCSTYTLTTLAAGFPQFVGKPKSPFLTKPQSPFLANQWKAPYTKDMRQSPLWDRFWLKVSEDANGCWVWQGALDKGGYGRIGYKGRTFAAHRISYRWWKGPIPSWLQLDHLCRNRACVNPSDLEAVTQDVNVGRGYKVARTLSNWRPKDGATHCPNGHPWTPENTIIRRWERYPKRRCRTCQLERVRDWRRRRKAAA